MLKKHVWRGCIRIIGTLAGVVLIGGAMANPAPRGDEFQSSAVAGTSAGARGDTERRDRNSAEEAVVAAGSGQIIEEVLVTGRLSSFGATKSATPILETSRSVSIETEASFRAKGAMTLDDTLNYTAGAVGDTFGFSTRGDFARIRGFDAAEFRDGQQVLFGFYNNTRSDIFMLEQVEILKGPASVLYGKGTPGGIVNAVSKVAQAGQENEVIFSGGTHDRFQAAVDYNASLTDTLHARVVGVLRKADTQIDHVTDDAQIVMPSLTWDNGTTRATALIEWVDRSSDTAHQFLPLEGTACIDGAIQVLPASVCRNATGEKIETSTYLGQPGFNRYDTTSTAASILVAHTFNELFSIDGVLRYKDGEADYRQSWIDFGGVGVPRVDVAGDGGRAFYFSDAASEQLAADVRGRFAFVTGALDHEVFAGVSWQDVTTRNATLFAASQGTLNVYQPVYGVTPTAFLNDDALFDPGATEARDYGIYLNSQTAVGPWKLNLGVRHDRTRTETTAVTQTDEETSFSAGVLYTFDIGLSPYASFAKSFQPVIGTDGFTQNPLKPRRGEQWEFGFKFQPPGTRTWITAAWFDIEESNLPNPSTLIGQPGSQQEGVGQVQGYEIEARTVLGQWSLEANYSDIDTRSADATPFASIPEQQASAWVEYAVAQEALAGLSIGVGARYNGQRESNGRAAGGPVRIVTGSELLLDALVAWQRADWNFSVNLRNLTDKQFYGTCLARGDCFPGERRTAMLTVSRRFGSE